MIELLGALLLVGVTSSGTAAGQLCAGTVSYNGICTPKAFPPRLNYTKAVQDPEYLRSPPALINITIGRQLFVDDFLVESLSNAQRSFHSAEYDEASNPIIEPDQPWEGSFAMPFSGGVWWEDDKQRVSLFYRCGGFAGAVQDPIRVEGRPWPPPDPHKPSNGGPSGMCVAYSSDGRKFTKPSLPVRPGTNMVRDKLYDGNTIWLDKREPNPSRRYKGAFVDEDTHYAAYTLEASPDGVHWQRIVNKTGAIQDCSRIFYNPFRQVWAFSIKTGVAGFGRQRAYWER